jgi:hypothetical protein
MARENELNKERLKEINRKEKEVLREDNRRKKEIERKEKEALRTAAIEKRNREKEEREEIKRLKKEQKKVEREALEKRFVEEYNKCGILATVAIKLGISQSAATILKKKLNLHTLTKREMLESDLTTFRDLIAPHFSPETSSYKEIPSSVLNVPSAGHCAVVAVIINDLFGGKFVSCKVDGVSHWFNRIGAFDVDITGDQFGRPIVQVGPMGKLYEGTRIRKVTEVNDETLRRASILRDKGYKDEDRNCGGKHETCDQGTLVINQESLDGERSGQIASIAV